MDSQATSLNVNPYGQSGTRVHLDTGYYVTEAKLPAVTPALKVSALEVSCRASHPRARMSIYAYDWTRSRWAGVISDLPGVTDAAQSVPNPRRFVRLPGGVVRLKVEMMPASGKAVSPPGSVGGMMKGPGMMGAGGGPNSVERLEIAMKGTAR